VRRFLHSPAEAHSGQQRDLSRIFFYRPIEMENNPGEMGVNGLKKEKMKGQKIKNCEIRFKTEKNEDQRMWISFMNPKKICGTL
jgi:hypothetical protein